MIPNSFPRTQGQLSQVQYLTLLILALIEQSPSHELIITAQASEKVDSGGRLLVDWDSERQQIVLHRGTSALVVVEVRGSGWTSVSPTQPAQAPPTVPDPTKHRSPLTDEQMFETMQKWWARQRMKEWREQGAAAVGNMPPPEDEPTA